MRRESGEGGRRKDLKRFEGKRRNGIIIGG